MEAHLMKYQTRSRCSVSDKFDATLSEISKLDDTTGCEQGSLKWGNHEDFKAGAWRILNREDIVLESIHSGQVT